MKVPLLAESTRPILCSRLLLIVGTTRGASLGVPFKALLHVPNGYVRSCRRRVRETSIKANQAPIK